MRSFPTEKALVTSYWQKLARSNGTGYNSRRLPDRHAAVRSQEGAPRRRHVRACKIFTG
jgi:hypothetical protein